VKQEPRENYNNTQELIRNTFNAGLLLIQTLPTDQFFKKLENLNNQIKQSLQLNQELNTIFEQKDIQITGLKNGSLYAVFRFRSKAALLELWKMYSSGELLIILQNGLITENVLKSSNSDMIRLDVSISKKDYEVCLEEIGT